MTQRLSQSSDGFSESSSRRTGSTSSTGPYIPIKRGSTGSEILQTIPLDQSAPIEKAKVAIPRHRSGAAPRNPGRVPRACESCRLRKTKCSGDNPVCKQCYDLTAKCVYPLTLKEKTKQQIRGLSQRLQECEDLLREVENLVSEDISKRIRDLLNQGNDSDNMPHNQSVSDELMQDANSVSSLSVGSLDSDIAGMHQKETNRRAKSESGQSHDESTPDKMIYRDLGIGVTKPVRTW